MPNICPKCKNVVGEEEIRCPHCNMRLKVICPVCKTANIFGLENCEQCGTVLLKYCDNCNSANLPEAQECRKCHSVFDEKFLTIEKKPSAKNENLIANTISKEQAIEERTVNAIEVEEEPETTEEIQLSEDEIIEETEEIYEQEETSEEELSAEEAQPAEQEQLAEEPFVEEQQEEIVPQEEQEEFAEEDIANTEDIVAESTVNLELSDENANEEEAGQINYSSETQGETQQEDDVIYCNNAQQLTEQLINNLQTPNTIVTAVCGEEGIGKSTAIKSFTDKAAELGLIPIVTEGSELIKLSPYGCMRDAFLKLLSLPDFHPDIQTFYSEETRQLFVQNFETLSDEEISDFRNFLYPLQKGDFKNIYINQEKTDKLLEKIISSIIEKNPAVLVIDNFDLIDSASFELINKLIKNGIISAQTKLFVSYRENKSAKYYFDEEIQNQPIFTTFCLENLNEEETANLIKSIANTMTVPTTVSFTINEKGRGNIFFTEQFLSLLFDVGYIYLDSDVIKFKEYEPLPFIPNNIEEVIQLRYNSLADEALKDSLLTASVLGYKFDKSVFAAVLDINEQQTNDILQKLTDLMLLQPASDYEYSFKNVTEWSVIFEIAQADEKFKAIGKKVYYIFSKYTLSNPVLKAIAAKYREEAETVLQSWREAAAICAYLGDIESYTTAIEQILIASGYQPNELELTEEQIELLEQFGKLCYITKPQKAVEYLTAPIITAKNANNTAKVIDLCSYLIKSCYLISDYSGVIEAVDLLLATEDSQITDLDKAIIKSKKLHALFKIGNCEEGINLANNDIIPQLEAALSQQNEGETMLSLFTAWFDASLNLANLYALQGNSKAIEIAENTEEIIRMNNMETPEYTVRINLTKAFALTVVGRIPDSAKILKETEQIPEYAKTDYIVRRNLIYALNLIFSETTSNLKEQLYDFAKYSNDNNDQFGKHIFKMMFAWMVYNSGNYEKANVIFNDELTYFAKIKTVTGALISWMFIAKNTLATQGSESAEHIALKALEVAQNPKFSQYHAAIYLQKLIAEINLIKGDINAAKMYLEKAMLTAKQFGLDLAQIELYRTYTKFLEQSMLQSEQKSDFASKANKIYKAAILLSTNLKIPNITAIVQKEQQALFDYCAENNIEILEK